MSSLPITLPPLHEISKKLKDNQSIVGITLAAVCAVGGLYGVVKLIKAESLDDTHIPEYADIGESENRHRRKLIARLRAHEKKKKDSQSEKQQLQSTHQINNTTLPDNADFATYQPLNTVDESAPAIPQDVNQYTESDDDAGFSIDEHYVPSLRIRPQYTQRSDSKMFHSLYGIYSTPQSERVDRTTIEAESIATPPPMDTNPIPYGNGNAPSESVEIMESSSLLGNGAAIINEPPIDDHNLISSNIDESMNRYDSPPQQPISQSPLMESSDSLINQPPIDRIETEQPSKPTVNNLDRLRQMMASQTLPASLRPDSQPQSMEMPPGSTNDI